MLKRLETCISTGSVGIVAYVAGCELDPRVVIALGLVIGLVMVAATKKGT